MDDTRGMGAAISAGAEPFPLAQGEEMPWASCAPSLHPHAQGRTIFHEVAESLWCSMAATHAGASSFPAGQGSISKLGEATKPPWC